jgi:Fanconi anemia group M protein
MILCDNRESRCIVPKQLEALHVPIEWATLEMGDYVIVGDVNIVVERKEAKDYIDSLRHERLNNQLYRMSCNYPFTVLIVEGWLSRAARDAEMTRKQLFGSLAGAILKRSPDGEQGVTSIVFTDNEYDTALLLERMRYRIRKKGGLIRVPRIESDRADTIDRALIVLASFPGVGEVRARTILSHPELNTLAKVLAASTKTLMAIPGIGKSTASDITTLARKKYGD